MSLQIKLLYGFNLFLILISFLFPASAHIQNTSKTTQYNTAKNLYLSLKKITLKIFITICLSIRKRTRLIRY